MRVDGRRWDEMRAVRMVPGFVPYAEGSVLIEVGGTRVLCNASVEESLPRWRQGSGAGWITAEYAMLPRSTHKRTPREAMGQAGRTHEIRRLIERTIILDCDVIQADGGTRTAAITGSYVALALAVESLAATGLAPEGVLVGQVAAVSLGWVGGQLLLDLCYAEDAAATADFNVVVTGDGRLVEVQGTAEGEPFSRRALDAVLDLANKGIGELLAAQRQLLGK
jgi:ribonuclease PH